MTTNNTAIEIKKPAHGSMDWLNTRHRYNGKCIVGSSEVSAVMGANTYETAIDLAVRKLQPVTQTTPNEAMTRGNVLEPALIQHAQNELMMPLLTPGVMYLNGRIIATLDARGMGGDNGVVVEAKTNNRWTHGTELPLAWWWQAQAQMYCTDTERVTFVVLDKNMRLGLQVCVRVEQSVTQMVEWVDAFCGAIDEQRLPDDSVLTAPQVAALYATPDGTVELGENALHLITEWENVKNGLKEYEAREKAVKDAIANALRDKEFGTVNGKRVLSYKAQNTTRLDSKALALAHPDIARDYTTLSTYRVLRITK